MDASALLPVRLVNKNGEGKLSPMDDDAPAPPSAAPGRGATDAALLAADGGLGAPWARGLGDLMPAGAACRAGPRLPLFPVTAVCAPYPDLTPTLPPHLCADGTLPFAHWAVGDAQGALTDVPIVR
jgi:hypothetical protein